jgi:hypothetical protein
MVHETTSWAESEFAADWAAFAVAAKGGDAKAQFALGLSSNISDDARYDWMGRALGQNYIDALDWCLSRTLVAKTMKPSSRWRRKRR